MSDDLPFDIDQMEEAALLLEEQQLTPANREASKEAIAAMYRAMQRGEATRATLQPHMEVLRKTAPEVARFLQRDEDIEKLTPFTVVEAQQVLDELTLRPVDRDAAEEALTTLEEQVRQGFPEPRMALDQLHILQKVAPRIVEWLQGLRD